MENEQQRHQLSEIGILSDVIAQLTMKIAIRTDVSVSRVRKRSQATEIRGLNVEATWVANAQRTVGDETLATIRSWRILWKMVEIRRES